MRKPPDKRNAAPVARDGGDFRSDDFPKASPTLTYPITPVSASELAARLFSRRYGLAPHVSRLVCHLAGLGGAA